jgi:hypothetical protein
MWLLFDVVRYIGGAIGIWFVSLISLLPGFLVYELLSSILEDYLP